MKEVRHTLSDIRIASIALQRMIFELNFPKVKVDDLDKDDLISLVNELQDMVNKLRNPKYHITPKQLIYSYLKSFPKFPKLQSKLLKLLSDQQSKEKKEIIAKLYGRKNDRPDEALRQLVVSTNKTIESTGSGDVFQIKGGDRKLTLKIISTSLSIYLKKYRREITK